MVKAEFMGRDDLIDRITQVKLWDVCTFGETQAKKCIIEPILDRLDWDTSSPSEVKLEYSLPREGRVDYALLKSGNPIVFVEAKAPAKPLDGHTHQLLKYSFAKSVELAVLTNGIEWWLFLPMASGEWDDRKFYAIDLKKQDIEEVSDRLIEFLCKENVISGSAHNNAKEMRRSTERAAKICDTVPKVWNDIISKPHEVLVDLLVEETERACGFKPDKSTIETFIVGLTRTGVSEKSGKEEVGRPPEFKGTQGGGGMRPSRRGRKSLDDRTFELVRDNPHRYNEEEISQIICEEYADDKHTADTLHHTTHRRLHGHLDTKMGIRIEKDAEGKYFVAE